MKARILKSCVPILMGIAAVAICFLLYYVVDVAWNGAFVDWFTKRYMITHEVYSEEVEGNIIMTEPLWPRLKVLIFEIFVFIVIGCLSVTLIAAGLHAKAQVRISITKSARMIHEFMVEERSGIFPKEYAEVLAQMLEFKAVIKRHEQLLKEEADRKNDLTAYLAHDLKTPLTSVIGYLTLLKEAPDMPAEQKERYLEIAVSKALRLEKLINEFFEISRYNLNQIELEKETIDLSYMLIQMTDEFYPLLTSHKNTVSLRVDESLTIYGDGVKLDTIFDRFFRLDEARTADTGGAGLGLAIAKEIVFLHGGEISADSENEQTVFRVTLPS